MANNKKKKKKAPSQGTKKPVAAKAASAPAVEKAAAPAKKAVPAARKAAPVKKKGLSATAQWALIGAIGFAIIGIFVILPAVTDAADDGGPGDDGFDGGFVLAQDIQGLARNGLYRSLGGTGGMPITAFYDANGELVDTAFLPFNEPQLENQLAALGFTS